MIKKAIFLFCTGLFIISCNVSTSPVNPYKSDPVIAETWWETAVFYELFIRSFYDSNGDGVGDLQGIIEKLDYLNDGDPNTQTDLGVTAIWLMPLHPASSYHGYDVTDYYAVHPDYGTLDDFQQLIEEAHARGIYVILDLVLNHTSDQHDWFVNSGQGQDAILRDWYRWTTETPTYFGPWEQNVWHLAGQTTQGEQLFYYGLFSPQMPDLNLENPEVTAQLYDVARFWIEEMGVDGFRIDAARHLIEAGEQLEDAPSTYTWLTEFTAYIHSLNPEAVVLGETWTFSYRAAEYVNQNSLDLAFDFDLAEGILFSINDESPDVFASRLRLNQTLFPAGKAATFLTNHDQNRAIYQLTSNTEKAKLAASILLTLPGVPFIYYGEEIGLTGFGDNLNKRRPFHWNASEKAGFTTGVPWTAIPTVGRQNLGTQASIPQSLFRRYRLLLDLRAEHLALQQGGLASLASSCASTFGYVRYYPQSDPVLILLNFADDSVANCIFSLPEENGVLVAGQYQLNDLLLDAENVGEVVVQENGRFTDLIIPNIDAHGAMILHLHP